MYPYTNPSLLNQGLNIIKNIKWGAILDGTQKTLGVVNQAIPVFYQIKPLVENTKTMFRVANAINSPNINNITEKKEEKMNNTSPIFYI